MQRLIYRPEKTAVYTDNTSKVIIYDHRAGQPQGEIDVDVDEFAIDLSDDAKSLFTTDWRNPRLTRWSVSSGEKVETYSIPHRMGQLCMDRTGQRVAFLAPKGYYLFDLQTQEELKIDQCAEDLRFASFSRERNQLLIGMRRKGKITEIDFEELNVIVHDLPIDATVRWLAHHPGGRTYTVLDSKKRVSSFHLDDHEPLWQTSLKKPAGKMHVGVAAHSGDGTLIGAVATGATNDVVVIEATTGEIVSHFADCGACGNYPYRGSLVLSQYVQKGQPPTAGDIFDLATGKRDRVNLDEAG